MKLTLAITVFNRYTMLLESFAGVIDDPRIDEILIMDDHSGDEYWNKIKELPKFNPKIKVVRQLENRGMSINKRDAVFNSKNDWVILFDSDNIIGKDYLDACFDKEEVGFDPHVIYSPSFAKPNFDYRKYQSFSYRKDPRYNVKKLIEEPMFNCMLNTCNYMVHRQTYLQTWMENAEMKGSDTIWFSYLWLKAGLAFIPVKGMHYEHRVHPGSGFLTDVDYNMKKAEEIKKLIMAL